MRKKRNASGKLNLLLLVSTLISAGVTGLGMHCFHNAAFYAQRESRLYMPLVMGGLFAAFLAVTGLVVFLISNLKLTYRADVITGRNSKGRLFLYLLIGILVIGLFMMGAEFLYENDISFRNKDNGMDTYVFLIDDSYSMTVSDPEAKRYSVIGSMLADRPAKTQFAVYSFSDEVKLHVPMRTAEEGFPGYSSPVYGLTNMKIGLEQVIEDCEQGIWTNKGNTTVIVITDGAPTDFSALEQIRSILDRYVGRSITIGIVGVIGADKTLMNEIAAYTGGTFAEINDAAMMNEAVENVSGNTGRTRDLLSVREKLEQDWIYAVIRILAFAIAGAVIAVVSALCYGNNTAFAFIVVANVIKAILAGVLMEVAFRLPAGWEILRMVSWILLGTVIARHGCVDEPEFTDTMDMDFFDEPVKQKKEYYSLR